MGFAFRKPTLRLTLSPKTLTCGKSFENGDFYFEIEDSETKTMKETPYELRKDNQKKQLGKNNKANVTLYNALPQYEKLSISNEETIDSGFT
ncbi:hypothetical protein Tco_1442013 [Tanacetum coccineum]